ncbi:hypothetical protein SD462_002608 [Vibrio alginolyticus]|uniref:hypothetical protein n=1 Tax=Vibrio alginolyticus TaxID=663 RepID=UPI002160A1AF|nr:hypothetical protein [Vibrio alginolyticus]ELU8567418.1 hypothetical protein [Vibrio alginolyticus]MCS0136477.1 hypothetical protein [Vibrio alginolyticus]
MKVPNKTLEFIISSFLTLFAMSVSKVSGLVINMLCIKYLGQSEFGQLSYLRSTAALFEGISAGGNNALTITESKDKRKTISIILSYLIYFSFFSLLIFLLFFFKVDGVSLFSFNEIAMIVIIFLFSLGVGMINSMLIGNRSNKLLLNLSVLSSLISLVVASVLIIFFGYIGAVLSIFFYFFIDFSLKFNSIYSGLFSSVGKVSLSFFFRSLRYSFISLTSLFLFWFVRTKVVSQSGGLEVLAAFELSYQFVTVVMIIIGSLISNFLARMSSNLKSMLYMAVAIILIAITLSVIAFFSIEIIVPYINGAYLNVIDEIKWTVFISIPFSLQVVFSRITLHFKEDWINLVSGTFSSFICLAYLLNTSIYDIRFIVTLYSMYYCLFVGIILLLSAFKKVKYASKWFEIF